jgi:hypothetical protein
LPGISPGDVFGASRAINAEKQNAPLSTWISPRQKRRVMPSDFASPASAMQLQAERLFFCYGRLYALFLPCQSASYSKA